MTDDRIKAIFEEYGRIVTGKEYALIHAIAEAVAPQRKPLTDEQLMIALLMVDPETKRLPSGFRAFARAIEAAHGIGDKA